MCAMASAGDKAVCLDAATAGDTAGEEDVDGKMTGLGVEGDRLEEERLLLPATPLLLETSKRDE